MARTCGECEGSGKMADDNYCSCKEGRLLKRLREAQVKAEEIVKKRQDEKDNAAETVKKIVEEVKTEYNTFKPGEWVEDIINGVIGIVTGVVDGEARFIAHHIKKTGRKYDAAAWLPVNRLKPAEIETFPGFDSSKISKMTDELTRLHNIDVALDNRDEELFYKLTGGNKNG